MAVIKRRRRVRLRNGRQVTRASGRWYVRYRGADGLVKTVPGYADKEATRQLEAKLKREVALADVGGIDRYKKHRHRPLMEYLTEFRQVLSQA